MGDPGSLTIRFLGPVEIPNRFSLSPHGVGYNVGYEPSDVFAEYYETRAAGGCGLLVHAMSTMPKRGGGSLTTPYPERSIPSFRAVANAVHRQGSKIFAEIHYCGWARPSGICPSRSSPPCTATAWGRPARWPASAT
jgi:2,4-dienoyl-CoA reductase-like NADH-dependent reductase (Old Yellow Enzyme family)